MRTAIPFQMQAIAAAAMLLASLAADLRAADARLEIELVADRTAPPLSQQEWVKTLADLGQTGIHVRAARPGDAVGITSIGTANAPAYRITGQINTRGAIIFSGGTFAQSDSRRLAEWLAKIAKGGPDGANADKPAPFGLTSKSFATVNQDLSRTVEFTTKDQSADSVVGRLGKLLEHPLVFDDAARRELATGEKVYDELVGVSAGTALAAALRPSGLIVRPRVAAGRVELLVTSSEGQKELWPIGWKPDQAPGKLLPQLADQQTFEIEDAPLSDILPVIAKQLKAPLLLDHNALVSHDIELSKVNVNIPRQKLVYAAGLRKVLSPHLKYEVRVDEAGKPFLWLTTVKR